MTGSDGSVTFDAKEADGPRLLEPPGWPYLAGWKPEVIDGLVLVMPPTDDEADPERSD